MYEIVACFCSSNEISQPAIQPPCQFSGLVVEPPPWDWKVINSNPVPSHTKDYENETQCLPAWHLALSVWIWGIKPPNGYQAQLCLQLTAASGDESNPENTFHTPKFITTNGSLMHPSIFSIRCIPFGVTGWLKPVLASVWAEPRFPLNRLQSLAGPTKLTQTHLRAI